MFVFGTPFYYILMFAVKASYVRLKFKPKLWLAGANVIKLISLLIANATNKLVCSWQNLSILKFLTFVLSSKLIFSNLGPTF